jgi:DNA-binding FrmR family transcriptional regulator
LKETITRFAVRRRPQLRRYEPPEQETLVPGAAKEQVVSRLNIIHDHLQGVRKMVQNTASCPQIVYELRAVNGALARIEEHLVEEHLRLCLKRSGIDRLDEVLEEVFELWGYRSISRKHQRGGERRTTGRS